jgi:hypothetical protein
MLDGAMRFESPAARAAYRRGARDAFDWAFLTMAAPEARALTEWLVDLKAWRGGDPPPPPQAWK